MTADMEWPCVPKTGADCPGDDTVPVCGMDGVTYNNKCTAIAACQFVYTLGTCPEPTNTSATDTSDDRTA